mmetsp:Transcript_81216/g.178505  ORF Transcript_81216/g.178505 Transcript_81216/m.178505 type:complete len:730 (+) Transcript_81216:193-2382(+)
MASSGRFSQVPAQPAAPADTEDLSEEERCGRELRPCSSSWSYPVANKATLTLSALGLMFASLVGARWLAGSWSSPSNASDEVSVMSLEGAQSSTRSLEAQAHFLEAHLHFASDRGLCLQGSDAGQSSDATMRPCQRGELLQSFLLPTEKSGPIRMATHPDLCLVALDKDQSSASFEKCSDRPFQIWAFPANGQGQIKLKGEERCLGKNADGKIEVVACETVESAKKVDQQFLFSHRGKSAALPTIAQKPVSCNSNPWKTDSAVRDTCSSCSAAVRLSNHDHRHCNDFCISVGRTCRGTHIASEDDGCKTEDKYSCSSQLRYHAAHCECGEKRLLGNVGSVTEFWLDPEAVETRIMAMESKFGVKEFFFEYAYEGFSKPPASDKEEWKCAVQHRPVKRETLRRAVAKVKELGGRAWLALHPSAVDKDDAEMLSGQWYADPMEMSKKLGSEFFEFEQARRLQEPPARKLRARGLERNVDPDFEETYEQKCGCDVGDYEVDAGMTVEDRRMDAVRPSAEWALRKVPAWAVFAQELGFAGIHWVTLGDFAQTWRYYDEDSAGRSAPDPDFSAFMRAASWILKDKLLEQSASFVDGFGYEPSLLDAERPQHSTERWIAEGGPAVAFLYWEVWSGEAKEALFKEAASFGEHSGFVMAMYPGYSKYHCCSANEKQNTHEHGVWPFDLAIKRWSETRANGGTYRLIVDGLRFMQGPFAPDAVRMSDKEVSELVKSWK